MSLKTFNYKKTVYYNKMLSKKVSDWLELFDDDNNGVVVSLPYDTDNDAWYMDVEMDKQWSYGKVVRTVRYYFKKATNFSGEKMADGVYNIYCDDAAKVFCMKVYTSGHPDLSMFQDRHHILYVYRISSSRKDVPLLYAPQTKIFTRALVEDYIPLLSNDEPSIGRRLFNRKVNAHLTHQAEMSSNYLEYDKLATDNKGTWDLRHLTNNASRLLFLTKRHPLKTNGGVTKDTTTQQRLLPVNSFALYNYAVGKSGFFTSEVVSKQTSLDYLGIDDSRDRKLDRNVQRYEDFDAAYAPDQTLNVAFIGNRITEVPKGSIEYVLRPGKIIKSRVVGGQQL